MKLFDQNLSSFDRIMRGVIGVAILFLTLVYSDFIGDTLLQVLLIIFAALNLLSFASGFCVVYKIAGISTKKE
ncbi:YgaP family membrane protein [Catenovulum agarivorans]|mgnify:CR=1 FL=1|uniref:YgaP family membrane protein n=1 Tax=Catenovulum agarivorans TaxID=1172192 RepID=UPI0002EEC1F0|nr:DUF2892 domain-containing protein [Catenovulum agarivorans]